MSEARRGALVIAAAVIALAAVWQWLPPSAPPLYDSVCGYPTYSYLNPPPGAAPAPAPSPVSLTVPLQGGIQPVMTVMTNEANNPQAQLIANAESFVPPAGASSVVVDITAVTPPSLPADGTVDSNVYRFRVSSGGKELSPTTPVTVILATATDDNDPRVLEVYSGGHWKDLETVSVACNNSWGSSVRELGDFVLVKRGTPSKSGGGAGAPAGGGPGWLFGVLALIVLAGVAVALRSRRSH